MQAHALTDCSDVVSSSDQNASFIVARARRLPTGSYVTTRHYVTTFQTGEGTPGLARRLLFGHSRNAPRPQNSDLAADLPSAGQRSAHEPLHGTAPPRTPRTSSSAATGLLRACTPIITSASGFESSHLAGHRRQGADRGAHQGDAEGRARGEGCAQRQERWFPSGTNEVRRPLRRRPLPQGRRRVRDATRVCRPCGVLVFGSIRRVSAPSNAWHTWHARFLEVFAWARRSNQGPLRRYRRAAPGNARARAVRGPGAAGRSLPSTARRSPRHAFRPLSPDPSPTERDRP